MAAMRDEAGVDGARERRVRLRIHVALVVVGAISVVLGFVGFVELSRSADESLGVWTILYGVVTLFTINGPIEDVPVALSIARLTAPLVTLGVVIDVLLRVTHDQIQRRRARRAEGHTVVLGRGARTRRYGASDPGRHVGVRRVRYGPGLPEGRRNDISIDIDDLGGDAWIERCSARHAERVIIATGSDFWNLVALADLLPEPSGPTDSHRSLEGLVATPGADRAAARVPDWITVEIDDPEAALAASTQFLAKMTASGPVVDVVCPVAFRAMVGAKLLIDHGGDPPVVICVGDGPVGRAVAREVAHLLAERPAARDQPELVVVRPDAPQAALSELRRELAHDEQFRLSVTADLRELVDPRGCPDFRDRTAAVLVDLPDRDESGHHAIDLAGRSDRWAVYVSGLSRDMPLAGLRALDDEHDPSDDEPVGPFTLLARQRHDHARNQRCDADQPPWKELTHAERLRRTRVVMVAAAHLIGDGYRLVRRQDQAVEAASAPPVIELPLHQRIGLRRAGLAHADSFPMDLRSVGLALLAPKP